jgi:hypothetical protein
METFGKERLLFLGPLATTSNVYATNLDGNHPDKTVALFLNVMIFQTLQILLLSLTWFDLEADWDYITFEYSIDAGDTWTILELQR